HRDRQPGRGSQVGRAVGPGGDQGDREQVAGRELAAAVEDRARSAAGGVADDEGKAPDALADMEAHDTALEYGIVRDDISRTVGVVRQSGQVHVDLLFFFKQKTAY